MCQYSDKVLREWVFKRNGEAIECCIPILGGHAPILRGFPHRQVDDLNRRLLRKFFFSCGSLCKYAVDRFEHIRCLNHTTEFRGRLEERNPILPLVSPGLGKSRKVRIPGFREFFPRLLGYIERGRSVNRIQITGHRFVFLVADIPQRITYEMHQVDLQLCFGKDGAKGTEKTVETLNAGDKEILEAVILKIRQPSEPEHTPFVLRDPPTPFLLLSLRIDAHGQVNMLPRDAAVDANFDQDCVEIHGGIDLIRRQRLLLMNLLLNPFGDL